MGSNQNINLILRRGSKLPPAALAGACHQKADQKATGSGEEKHNRILWLPGPGVAAVGQSWPTVFPHCRRRRGGGYFS